MAPNELYEFQVQFSHDHETSQVVASIPALDIADYGADNEESFHRLKEMLVFHLESLLEEGKPVPAEEQNQEGLYLRVRVPNIAA